MDSYTREEISRTEQLKTVLARPVTMGAGTLGIAEAVAGLAHLGPTGMFVGGLAAFVAYRHGPDIVRVCTPAHGGTQGIRERLVSSLQDETERPAVLSKMPRSPHFPRPLPQKEVDEHEQEPAYPADLEEEDVSLSQFDPPVRDTPLLERGGLNIAESFRPSAASFCGQCVSICGMRRKGKSNLLTVLAEELAAQRPTPPILLLDTEDEYGPLAHPRYFSRGIAAGAREGAADVAPGVEKYMVVTRANASAFGRAIVEQRLQVVLNLKSYTDEDACFIMEGLVKGIDGWQQERRADAGESRLPVFVFLDEATKWMPQNQGEMRLTQAAKAALYQTFYDIIVRRGGKRGWNLIAAFQKLAEIDKRLLQASYKFIFGQSEPPDLEKCRMMGLNPEVVKALRPGECFAFCPQREGAMRIQVRRCHSYHVGSTPSFENLARGEGRVARNLDGVIARFAEAEPEEPPRSTVRTFPAPARPDTPVPVPVPAGRHTETAAERELRKREEWQRQTQAPAVSASPPYRTIAPVLESPVRSPRAPRLLRTVNDDPELLLALQAYQDGYTTSRQVADRLTEQGHPMRRDKANDLLNELVKMGEIERCS